MQRPTTQSQHHKSRQKQNLYRREATRTKLKAKSITRTKPHTNKMPSALSLGRNDKMRAINSAIGAETTTANAINSINGDGPRPRGIKFIHQKACIREKVSRRLMLRYFCLQLHSPVAGKVRRDINIGRIGLKSFGRDLQLESAKARVREFEESMLVGLR
jgi:hypothetical protein